MCDNYVGDMKRRGFVRLTLFETAGCATLRDLARLAVLGPPHALRNRGMCDEPSTMA